MSEDQDTSVGPHRLREEGDILIFCAHGLMEAEHVMVTYPRSVAMARRYGYALNLINAEHATAMSAEARRISGTLSRSEPIISATAVFGASLLSRTLVTLVWRAVALLASKSTDLAFFATESEARKWLALQRPKLLELVAQQR